MLAVFLYEHGSENNSDARMSWGLARVPWVSRAPDVSLELSMCHTSHLLELKKKKYTGIFSKPLNPSQPASFPAVLPLSPNCIDCVSDMQISLTPSSCHAQGLPGLHSAHPLGQLFTMHLFPLHWPLPHH